MYYVIILISVILLSAIAGTRMYLLNPSDSMNKTAFASFILTTLFALIEYSFCLTNDQAIANVLGLLHQTLSVPILLSYFVTSRLYSAQNKKFPKWYHQKIMPIYYLIFGLLMLTVFSENWRIAHDPIFRDNEWHFLFNKDNYFFWLYVGWIGLTAISAVFNFYHGYKNAEIRVEKQRRLFLLVLFICIPIGISYVFLYKPNTIDLGKYLVSPWLFICILGLSVAYSNYQLLQINPLKAFQNIMKSLTNQVMVVNNKFEVVYVNTAAKNLMERQEPDFSEHTSFRKTKFSQFVSFVEGDWKDLRKELQNLKQQSKLEKEIQIQFPSETKNLLVTFSPVFVEKAKLGYSVVASDITTHKQYEIKLEQYANELIEKNQELERFAYIASHDLKTPLRNIVSFLGLINRKIQKMDNEDLIQYIEIANQNARHMFSLVEDVLEFSRLNKNSTLEFQPTNLNQLVQQAVHNLEDYIKEKKAVISCEPLPQCIEVDAQKIVQLFQNLIENGLKYNKSNPPQIHIKIEAGSDDYVFAIQDNGIGIEVPYQDTVFDMFKRLHNQQEYEGTGIGLAICKKIVEYHQGKIWLESKLGEGTVFRFSLKKQLKHFINPHHSPLIIR